MKKPILIGIAGASGSGKTHVADCIIESIGSEKAIIIQEDFYYKDLSDMPFEERACQNFDHPDAFDHALLAEHLLQPLNGETISRPIYDYKIHTRIRETKTIEPRDLIILEGILIFNTAQLRDLMNLRVFMDTDLDTCLTRRLKRDTTERGRTADSVIQQYEKTVRPMYYQFIEPSKNYADILIPGPDENSSTIDNLIKKINALIN